MGTIGDFEIEVATVKHSGGPRTLSWSRAFPVKTKGKAVIQELGCIYADHNEFRIVGDAIVLKETQYDIEQTQKVIVLLTKFKMNRSGHFKRGRTVRSASSTPELRREIKALREARKVHIGEE